jgi:hypothetical protein
MLRRRTHLARARRCADERYSARAAPIRVVHAQRKKNRAARAARRVASMSNAPAPDSF